MKKLIKSLFVILFVICMGNKASAAIEIPVHTVDDINTIGTVKYLSYALGYNLQLHTDLQYDKLLDFQGTTNVELTLTFPQDGYIIYDIKNIDSEDILCNGLSDQSGFIASSGYRYVTAGTYTIQAQTLNTERVESVSAAVYYQPVGNFAKTDSSNPLDIKQGETTSLFSSVNNRDSYVRIRNPYYGTTNPACVFTVHTAKKNIWKDTDTSWFDDPDKAGDFLEGDDKWGAELHTKDKYMVLHFCGGSNYSYSDVDGFGLYTVRYEAKQGYLDPYGYICDSIKEANEGYAEVGKKSPYVKVEKKKVSKPVVKSAKYNKKKHTITGKATKNTKVTIKCGKKTYKGKVSSKGKFTVKVKKGKTFKITVKNKAGKVSKTKTVKVKKF